MLAFRKSGAEKIKSLLSTVQAYLLEHDEDAAREEYQLPLIPGTQTFIKFGSEVDNGLSPLCGLIKYCSNTITVVKSGVENNVTNAPIVIHIGEKMAHIALAIQFEMQDQNVTDKEQCALVERELLAQSWLDNKIRPELMNDVNQRVSQVKGSLSEKGVLHTIKNQNEVLDPLLTRV